jgi:glycosyltransferase involved in cell wall biosynthesis
MKSNKVSIIMNCYNGEKYLHEAIISVLVQTYKNWELIFWDNNSIDNSADIFKSYKDKRLKYFLSKKKTILHVARNLALSKSKGKFITFIDTDDFWHKKKLETQMQLFKKKKDIACVHSKLWVKYQDSILPKKLFTWKNLPEGFIFEKLVKKYNLGFTTVILKKSTLKNFPNIFNTKKDFISDFDLIFNLAKKYKFACVQKPLSTYRKHKYNFSNFIFDRQIKQMDYWIKIKKKNSFLNKNQYIYLKKHIKYMKFKSKIIKSNFSDFIKLIFSKKNNYNFIKLIFVYLFNKF